MKLRIRRAYRNQKDCVDCWIPYHLRILRTSKAVSSSIRVGRSCKIINDPDPVIRNQQ